MSKQIFLALAAGFAAAAAAFEGGEAEASPAGTGAPAGEPAKRRGRPPGGGSAPAGDTANGAKTYDELRALIAPLIEGGQGEDVKKVIAKYGTSLKDIPADKQAAFVKDIDAMSY